MPRRLSDIPEAHMPPIFNQNAIQARNAQAMLVAGVISSWAYVEAGFGIVLARFLKANAQTATAIYSALHSFSAQRAALLAAATDALEQDDLDLLKDVLGAVTGLSEHRNHFAHWLWGYSPELLSDILLVAPKHVWLLQGQAETRLNDYDLFEKTGGYPTFDRSKVQVWNSQELMEIRDRVDYAAQIVTTLSHYYGADGQAREQIRLQIYGQDPVANARKRRLSKQMSTLAASSDLPP